MDLKKFKIVNISTFSSHRIISWGFVKLNNDFISEIIPEEGVHFPSSDENEEFLNFSLGKKILFLEKKNNYIYNSNRLKIKIEKVIMNNGNCYYILDSTS